MDFTTFFTGRKHNVDVGESLPTSYSNEDEFDGDGEEGAVVFFLAKMELKKILE